MTCTSFRHNIGSTDGSTNTESLPERVGNTTLHKNHAMFENSEYERNTKEGYSRSVQLIFFYRQMFSGLNLNETRYEGHNCDFVLEDLT